MNIIPNNFIVGSGRKAWCGRAMSPMKLAGEGDDDGLAAGRVWDWAKAHAPRPE